MRWSSTKPDISNLGRPEPDGHRRADGQLGAVAAAGDDEVPPPSRSPSERLRAYHSPSRDLIPRSYPIRQEMVRPSGIIPVDQLEECTVFATALLHLIEQREFVAVKSAEPLIPAQVLELVFTGAAWEIEAQHAP